MAVSQIAQPPHGSQYHSHYQREPPRKASTNGHRSTDLALTKLPQSPGNCNIDCTSNDPCICAGFLFPLLPLPVPVTLLMASKACCCSSISGILSILKMTVETSSVLNVSAMACSMSAIVDIEKKQTSIG